MQPFPRFIPALEPIRANCGSFIDRPFLQARAQLWRGRLGVFANVRMVIPRNRMRVDTALRESGTVWWAIATEFLAIDHYRQPSRVGLGPVAQHTLRVHGPGAFDIHALLVCMV